MGNATNNNNNNDNEWYVYEQINALKMVLRRQAPFLSSLVESSTFKVTKEVDIAASDAYKTIYINGDAFLKLPHHERRFVLLHEVLHMALRHHWRAEILDVEDAHLYNIAGDCVINGQLIQWGVIKIDELSPTLRGIVKPSDVAEVLGLDVKEVMQLSTDEIYHLLLAKKKQLTGKLHKACGLHSHKRAGTSREVESRKVSKKEADKYWSDAIQRAKDFAQRAGKLPGGIERIFEIGESQVEWDTRLTAALINGLRGKVVGTYRVPSRKSWSASQEGYFLPGYQKLTVPNVFFCVDTSGSISERELSIAASEIYAVAEQFQITVTVVFWDATVQDVQKFITPYDIVRHLKPKGGGGTVVKPTLEYLLKYMNTNDAVVIISDGEIADMGDREVRYMADQIVARSSAAIFLTTIIEPNWPDWEIIKVKV